MTINSILLNIILILLPFTAASAQNFDALWATGSAVAEGPRQLTKRPDGQFRFAGALNEGELKTITTDCCRAWCAR